MTDQSIASFSPLATTYSVAIDGIAEILAERSVVVEHTVGAFDSLFGETATGPLDVVSRLTIAWLSVSAQGSPLAEAYAEQLDALAGEGTAVAISGGVLPDDVAPLAAYVEKLSLSPVSLTAADVAAVVGRAGDDVLVVLSQIVSFVSYQLRVAAGLRAIAGEDAPGTSAPFDRAVPHDEWTMAQLDWIPRAAPLPDRELTSIESRALDLTDAGSPYFRLLARTPEVLVERTLTDHAIFRSPGGLPRGERELGAMISSMVNGCVYCASVHARFSAHYSKRLPDVEALLFGSLDTPLDARWTALVTAAAALAQPVPAVKADHFAILRALGLSDLELVDLVQATAFFAWANRLMLTLGDPELPAEANGAA